MIHIEGLSYRFSSEGNGSARGSECHALHDLSLKIEPGEFLVITGPSGCGKSTLALGIGGYLFRQFDGEAEGSITVAGMDVRECPIYAVAEVVGLVQQNPEAQFCTLTVRDEVAFGLENRCLPRDEIQKRIDWALRIVGAEHLTGRSLATLSGGEKQKVAIAAMMAAKPQVLIFDEPTSNLDPTATAEIFDVIEHIREKAGITVIVIEHKIGYLRRFNPRLIQMQDGQIIHDGAMKATSDKPFPWMQARPVSGHRGLRGFAQDRQQAARPNSPIPQFPISQLPVLHIQDLYAGYNGQPILNGISLQVCPGEFVSVMGDNGSGKSTFLQCLLGLLKPMSGCVEVLGQDTKDTPVSKVVRQVGFVFQNPDHQLFADSIWDEAVFASRNFGILDETTKAEITQLLDHCGLGNRSEEHPYRLSYGQKRRLNLISVLSYAPRLILLDEVLIGQDPDNAAFLLDLLQERVAVGAAVVMVNHAPRITRRYANRVLFFNSGQVIVDAPTDQAFSQLKSLGKEAYAA